MSRLCFAVLAVMALTSPFLGCKGSGIEPIEVAAVEPGNDPIVVNAERVAAASLASFEAVVKYDHENLAVMKQYAPGVHATIQKLRKEFPPAWRQFRAATKTYKASRTVDNEDALSNAAAELANQQAMADQALEDATREIGAARPN